MAHSSEDFIVFTLEEIISNLNCLKDEFNDNSPEDFEMTKNILLQIKEIYNKYKFPIHE